MEKKNVKFGYGFLVIILFATVCFLTDYIYIGEKMRESNYNYDDVLNNNPNSSSNTSEVIALDEVTPLIDSQLYILNGKSSLNDLSNQKKLSLAFKLLRDTKEGNYPETFTSSDLDNAFNSSVFSKLSYEHENIIAVKDSELDGNIGYGCSYSNGIYTDCVSTNSGAFKVRPIYNKVVSFDENEGKYILSVKYLWGSYGETTLNNNSLYAKYSDSVSDFNSIGNIPYEILTSSDEDVVFWAKNNISNYEDKLETYNYVFVKENGKINLVDFYVK